MKKITTSLEIGANNIKLFQVETGNEGTTLLSLENSSFTSRDELISGLKNLSDKYKINTTYLVTILPRNQVFLKKISMPPGTTEEIRDMLKYEAERYLPFSAETAVIDFFPIQALSESSPNEIYLAAAKIDTINTHLRILEQVRLMPDEISITSLSIVNLLNTIKGRKDPSAFLLYDNDGWEIDVLTNGKLALSRGFNLQSNSDNKAETIKNEIINTFNMFQSSGESANINLIYCLKSQLNDTVIENLKNSFDTRFEEFKVEYISSAITIPENINPDTLDKCLIPAGLLLPSEQKINLLPADVREAAAKKRATKMQLTVFSSVMLCLIIACSIVFWVNYRNSASNRKIAALVAANKHEILELERTNKQLEIISRFKVSNMLPLDILKEMSKNLPESVYIRQLNYDYSEGTVSLRGRAGSYATASKVLAQLGKSQYFSQITDKGSYTVKIGDKDLVDFETVCTIKK